MRNVFFPERGCCLIKGICCKSEHAEVPITIKETADSLPASSLAGWKKKGDGRTDGRGRRACLFFNHEIKVEVEVEGR